MNSVLYFDLPNRSWNFDIALVEECVGSFYYIVVLVSMLNSDVRTVG